jgi:hypothetical protein
MSEKYPNALWLWARGNPLAGYRDETTGMFYFASTPEILSGALTRSGIKAKKIGALADGRLLCLKVTKKGLFKGTYARLAIKVRKPQKPVVNRHPLIGMPNHDVIDLRKPCKGCNRHPDHCICGQRRLTDQDLFERAGYAMTDEGWKLWKEQGRRIKKLLH